MVVLLVTALLVSVLMVQVCPYRIGRPVGHTAATGLTLLAILLVASLTILLVPRLRSVAVPSALAPYCEV